MSATTTRRSNARRMFVTAFAAVALVVSLPGVAHAYNWRTMSATQSAFHTYGHDVSSMYSRRGIDPRLDTSTDGCSLRQVTYFSPWLVRFYDSCVRHDFGYRNFGKRGYSRTDATRAWVDQQFPNDMRRACSTVHWSTRWSCNDHANAFYAAVRIGARSAFFG